MSWGKTAVVENGSINRYKPATPRKTRDSDKLEGQRESVQLAALRSIWARARV